RRPGEDRVHRHAGQDDDHPLPHRLRLEGAVERNLDLRLASFEGAVADILFLAGHFDVAAEGKPRHGILGFATAEREPLDRSAQAEREAMDVNPRPLRGDEMPELMDEYEDAEDDD